MPPFRIQKVEVVKIPEISWAGEKIIFQFSEKSIVGPTLTAPGFRPEAYPSPPRMEIDLAENWAVRLPNFEVTEAGLVPVKNTALVPYKKGELSAFTRPGLVERYASDMAGLGGAAITGGLVGGAMYLLGVGMIPITMVVSVIALVNVAFGVFVGWFARSGGTPGFEIPIDGAGNHYAIGMYPHPWLPIRAPGDVIGYPVDVTRIEGERVEVSFKIFGLPRPFTLTMSESYARHRKLIPGKEYPKAGTGYYLIWGSHHQSSWIKSQEASEAEKNNLTPFRLSKRPSTFFAEGFHANFSPVRVYRLGDEPSRVKGEIRPIGAVEVYQGGGPNEEKLRVHYQEFDPYLDSIYSEEFFSIPLSEALRMGIVLQDLSGVLKKNPNMTHVFVEEREL